jgi:hypothetical protein
MLGISDGLSSLVPGSPTYMSAKRWLNYTGLATVYGSWPGSSTAITINAPGDAAGLAGDVYMFALDADNGALYMGYNGAWKGNGVPTSGSAAYHAAIAGISGTIYPMVAVYLTTSTSPYLRANFGASTFSYAPPSGYHAGLW